MVKSMKQLVLTVILLVLLLNISLKEDTQLVFNEEDGFNFYKITLQDKILSTKKIEEYFSNVEILTLTPYVNPLYKNQILEQSFQFDTVSISKNVFNLTNKYIYLLQKNGYVKDVIKIKLDGMYIKNMIVYCSEEMIVHLKNKIPTLQYKIIT